MLTNRQAELLSRLPDSLVKEEGSNNAKIAGLLTAHLDMEDSVNEKILKAWDIDNAEGQQLDLLGIDVGQRRGKASDSVYRILIKSRIKELNSTGTVNDIIDFVSFILSVDKSEVQVSPMWQLGMPATFRVIAPAGPVAGTGLSVRQFAKVIEKIAAGGVRVEPLFEGTFRLTTVEDAPGYEYGLSDVDMTIGGTLGYAYNPSKEEDLPI